jgi:predicted transglutaminase-like cysteine proteinase
VSQLDVITRINQEVNKLPYRAEVEEDWNPDQENAWDCDNYSTKKQLLLIEAGILFSDTRLITCFALPGQKGYHLILAVDVTDEDTGKKRTVFLSNGFPYPIEMDMLPFQIYKIQYWKPDGTSEMRFAKEFANKF